jgi:3-methyladenine DNA glycosylase/8-oxoguanine DNA glycosylase
MEAQKLGVFAVPLHGGLASVEAVARRILGVDWDLDGLHRTIGPFPELAWIIEGRHGRMLRSATLFEDLVKILFTTNTTWDRTKRMNDQLVAIYGRKVGCSACFPDPDVLCELDPERLRQQTGCGYRAEGIIDIAARALAAPDIFLGSGWRGLGDTEFLRLAESCRGIGPVSANYIVRAYGRPAGLALDAYAMRRCRELWPSKRGISESQIKKKLARYGRYSSLILWLLMTKHWHGQSEIVF